jgi:general secretion pathway protein D
VVALASAAVMSPSPAGATTISAPFLTLNVGDTFTVPISVADAVNLTSWQFDLAFDAAIVQANSVTEGPLLSSSGTAMTVFTPGFIDNGSGSILGVADSYSDFGIPPSGDGVLANIEFTALAPGISPLTFSNVFLNLFAPVDTSNGQITVTSTTPTPVPEPSTLLLLAAAVGTMLARRRYRRAQS